MPPAVGDDENAAVVALAVEVEGELPQIPFELLGFEVLYRAEPLKFHLPHALDLGRHPLALIADEALDAPPGDDVPLPVFYLHPVLPPLPTEAKLNQDGDEGLLLLVAGVQQSLDIRLKPLRLVAGEDGVGVGAATRRDGPHIEPSLFLRRPGVYLGLKPGLVGGLYRADEFLYDRDGGPDHPALAHFAPPRLN